MLTEILTNILGQNGWSEVLWILIQLAFFLIIFLLPLRLHDQKKGHGMGICATKEISGT